MTIHTPLLVLLMVPAMMWLVQPGAAVPDMVSSHVLDGHVFVAGEIQYRWWWWGWRLLLVVLREVFPAAHSVGVMTADTQHQDLPCLPPSLLLLLLMVVARCAVLAVRPERRGVVAAALVMAQWQVLPPYTAVSSGGNCRTSVCRNVWFTTPCAATDTATSTRTRPLPHGTHVATETSGTQVQVCHVQVHPGLTYRWPRTKSYADSFLM